MPAWWEQLLHIAVGRVDRHETLPDLRHLPSRPVALERTHYVVNDRERHGVERRAYVLRTMPRTRHNAGGVAVTSNGRGVGYLPAQAAEDTAPLLERLGGSAVVNGAGTKGGGIRLWIDLPVLESFREYVRASVA